MQKRITAPLSLAAAVGIAAQALIFSAAHAADKELPQVVKDNIARATEQKLEKCYGVNAVGKNDCAVGKHSCAGQATKARDPESIVLLPAGSCAKIDGGKVK
ncbi:DUF2282 domain-containing protein [Pseudoduganella sp. FT25W]|uniref:DUF2282 domain-containing protein n=1 Tax=Duganella alba TaxID=2666081 RepID=A0A6L5QR33_9BURK|nr:DUF2282 domain-containing protein [Duganella alba]MRX11782.1 DUF2282 domain-containing protein [Duganella alba]MRX20232.1 DUF2282 domain-containing protein [Duganella alba]